MMSRKKAASSPSEGSFSFIVSTGPTTTVDPEVRSMIRRQAMKNASAARKLRGNYGKSNLIQYPVFEATSSSYIPYTPESSYPMQGIDVVEPLPSKRKRRSRTINRPGIKSSESSESQGLYSIKSEEDVEYEGGEGVSELMATSVGFGEGLVSYEVETSRPDYGFEVVSPTTLTNSWTAQPQQLYAVQNSPREPVSWAPTLNLHQSYDGGVWPWEISR